MIRRAFIRRMVFAGLATWFLDLPLPSQPTLSDRAELLSEAYPMSAAEALDALAVGLGRDSAMILDGIGLTRESARRFAHLVTPRKVL